MFFDGSLRVRDVKVNVPKNPIIMHNHVPIGHNATVRIPERNNGRQDSLRRKRLERRWQFLASIDNDPIVIDGYTFRFDASLYTNII